MDGENIIFPFIFPFRAFVAGSSACGKSTLIAKIIKERDHCIVPNVQKILYFSKYINAVHDSIRNDPQIEHHTGLPDENQLQNASRQRTLLIFDDLQNEAIASREVISAFQCARHNSISIIFLSQNLFPARARDITLNCSYFIIFYCPRDSSSLISFGRQIDPRHPMNLAEIYFKYINKGFRYLVVDLQPTTPVAFRIRSNLFDRASEIFVSEEAFESIKHGEDDKEYSFVESFQNTQQGTEEGNCAKFNK